jgi:1,4-dihydroxy-2-naphthoate octaprenyltransferase
VAVGTGAAAGLAAADPGRAALAAGVALALQVGVNYANDYSDGVRGTDAVRSGPMRLTGSGAATPAAVRRAAVGAFAVAAVLGALLCALAQAWWLLTVGALAVAAAWGYTGGRHPYGYRGLGEVAVFTFFGLVAVLGTTYTQAGTISVEAVAGAVGIGSLACALLMANNIRDIPTDTASGKRTLAVRLGDRRARLAYVLLVTAPLVIGVACAVVAPWSAAVLVLAVPVLGLSRRVLGGATGRELVLVLRDTGLVELGYGVLLAVAFAL